MKKLLLVLLVALIAIPAFQSCKKGEHDPAISLKSRKARLVGEWTLVSGMESITQSGDFTYTISYNGSTKTTTVFGGPSTPEAYTEKMTINKDGSYEYDINDNGILRIIKGAWYFGRKNKDLDIKDKETVCFSPTSVNNGGDIETYTGADALNYPLVWRIDELKSKEIIILTDASTVYNSATITNTGTMTYRKK
jgi:hypothetical protein